MTPFLCLGISVLLLALLAYYFTQKVSAQNHKINSMFELVNTMAQEISIMRGKVGGSAVNHVAGLSSVVQPVSSHMPFSRSVQMDDTLIVISEEDETDDGEDETDEEDEDDDDDEEDEETDDEETDDEETDDEEPFKHIEEIDDEEPFKHIEEMESLVEEEKTEIKTIHIGEENLEESIPCFDLPLEDISSSSHTDFIQDLKHIHMGEIDDELEDQKNIDILDYKKLSLTKLRSILVEKGIVTDASRMKKPDILKLLEVE